MPKLRLKAVGLVVKHSQVEAASFALSLAQHLIDQGVGVVLDAKDSRVSSRLKKNAAARHKSVAVEKIPLNCDLVVVVGGDGTFLSAARHMTEVSVPILGINMGQLGFLTEIKKEEAQEVLDRILSRGVAPIQERTLFEADVIRGKVTKHYGLIVNDAVISKGAIARMLGIHVYVHGQWVQHVRSDGMIVSTPTGSTAYSLAAGGPILAPGVPAMMLTPICPHALTHRPIVLPDSEDVELEVEDRPGNVLLTLDGQEVIELKPGDRLRVSRFKKHKLKLISSPDRDYFGVLREKFKFGMRA